MFTVTGHNLSCIRNDRLLFRHLNFNVNSGEILHLCGENGVGKSSLLQILVGLLSPMTGHIFWQGVDTRSAPEYLNQLFYLGHKPGVKLGLTVKENLCLCASLSKKHQPIDMEALLDVFDLKALINTPTFLLSAGQKQRVALSQLLLTDAVLWVLDEPFTAIDQKTSENLRSLLRNHAKAGGMCVLTSHQSIDFVDIKVQQLQLSRESS